MESITTKRQRLVEGVVRGAAGGGAGGGASQRKRARKQAPAAACQLQDTATSGAQVGQAWEAWMRWVAVCCECSGGACHVGALRCVANSAI